MRAIDLVRTAAHSAYEKPARVLLTLSGVVIGAATITALSSLLRSAEVALVSLDQGVTESDTLRIEREDPPEHQREKATRELSETDAEVLARSKLLSGVEVAVEVKREVVALRRKAEMPVRLMGTDATAREMYRLELAEGRFLRGDDRGRRVAVIGQEVHRELFAGGKVSALGDAIEIDGVRWTVVGVLRHKPSLTSGPGTWRWNRRVLVPRTTFDAEQSASDLADSIFLRARRSISLDLVTRIAESTLLRRHHGVKNFEVAEPSNRRERAIIEIVRILVLGIGVLALVVGGINIMNIMLVTVSERTREIGIRRALGATPRSILAQFLLEAAWLSLVGGGIGVLTGLLFAWIVGLVLTNFFGEWELALVPSAICLSLALALSVGVVSALLPAWRASCSNPTETLRAD